MSGLAAPWASGCGGEGLWNYAGRAFRRGTVLPDSIHDQPSSEMRGPGSVLSGLIRRGTRSGVFHQSRSCCPAASCAVASGIRETFDRLRPCWPSARKGPGCIGSPTFLSPTAVCQPSMALATNALRRDQCAAAAEMLFMVPGISCPLMFCCHECALGRLFDTNAVPHYEYGCAERTTQPQRHSI